MQQIRRTTERLGQAARGAGERVREEIIRGFENSGGYRGLGHGDNLFDLFTKQEEPPKESPRRPEGNG